MNWVVLKTREFTTVNDCFQNKQMAEIIHYRWTLNSFGKKTQDFYMYLIRKY